MIDTKKQSKILYVLNQFNLGPPLKITRLWGGYGNTNYKIESKTDKYVVKFITANGHTDIKTQQQILTKLKRASIQVRLFLPNQNNDFIVRIDKKTYAAVCEYIVGSEPPVNNETCAQIARELAKVNNFNPSIVLNRNSRRYILPKIAEARLQKTTDYKDLKNFFAAYNPRFVNIDLHVFPHGLVHGDIFPDNTVFRNKKLTGIIDFEEATYAPLIFDLGIAINGFCFIDNRLDKHLLQTFLQNYQRVRKLKKVESIAISTFIAYGAHIIIAWHTNKILDKFDERKYQRAKYLIQRLESFINNHPGF